MPNGMYGGVRGRKTKVGRKLLRFPPTRFGIGTETKKSQLFTIDSVYYTKTVIPL